MGVYDHVCVTCPKCNKQIRCQTKICSSSYDDPTGLLLCFRNFYIGSKLPILPEDDNVIPMTFWWVSRHADCCDSHIAVFVENRVLTDIIVLEKNIRNKRNKKAKRHLYPIYA